MLTQEHSGKTMVKTISWLSTASLGLHAVIVRVAEIEVDLPCTCKRTGNSKANGLCISSCEKARSFRSEFLVSRGDRSSYESVSQHCPSIRRPSRDRYWDATRQRRKFEGQALRTDAADKRHAPADRVAPSEISDL